MNLHDVLRAEELLSIVSSRGLFVNNLFQLPGTSRWRCNLTDREDIWEFGDGESLVDALGAALLATNGERVVRSARPLTSMLPVKAPGRNLKKISLDEL